MGIQSMMPHRANVWRPTVEQATAQEITGYALFAEGVRCYVQPADVKESMYYEQRGQEGVASLYTTDVTTAYKRNDLFEVNGQQLHVTGIKPALFLNLYRELTVYWYPEDAKKRLSREAYD